jgi:hypothetical protein
MEQTMKLEFQQWFSEVRDCLGSINMAMADWQSVWPFDFRHEYDNGTAPLQTAEKANRYWWWRQNQARQQECRRTTDCWLPSGHQGQCQSV